MGGGLSNEAMVWGSSNNENLFHRQSFAYGMFKDTTDGSKGSNDTQILLLNLRRILDIHMTSCRSDRRRNLLS